MKEWKMQNLNVKKSFQNYMNFFKQLTTFICKVNKLDFYKIIY